MTALAYYNEIDSWCLVQPHELEGYGQLHFFAGIGGGPLACRLAGLPDDFPIITAGVPCQPASQAGKRLGAADERWLWPEFFRLLRYLRSHYALVEQPPGIVSLNAGREWRWVLGELAEIVSDLEVSRVSAADVGAPQERERVWIICYPDGGALADDNEQGRIVVGQPERAELEGAHGRVAARCDEGMGNGARVGRWSEQQSQGARRGRSRLTGVRSAVGDTGSAGWEKRDAAAEPGGEGYAAGECAVMGHTVGDTAQHGREPGEMARETSADESERLQRQRRGRAAWSSGDGVRPWDDAVPVRGTDGSVRLIPREAAEAGPESPLWPVADGIPGRVARLRAIGNAWVPQAAVPALRVILEHARTPIAEGR